jgi:parvulin-like peptidyl-prolyl isomerase
MKQRWRLLIAAAILLGVVAGESLCRWPAFRDLAGRATNRGGLVRIVNGKGIYETDLGGEDDVSAAAAILAENLQRAAAGGKVDPSRVEAQVAMLHAQFDDEKRFAVALRSAGLWEPVLRERIEEQLRELDWLEKQLAAGTAVTEQECRAFYDGHSALFTPPARYRVSHVFLAAHVETPAEVVAEKETAIAALATRLSHGESLSQLASEASEDEASKVRGGALGYLSEVRMPVEFMAEIKKLRVGETSKPFRSHLGFHIAQLAEIKPSRVLSFEEARGEIHFAIANEHRAAGVDRIAHEISAFASR